MSEHVCRRCGKSGHNKRTCGRAKAGFGVRNSQLNATTTPQYLKQHSGTSRTKGSVSEIYARYVDPSRPITANESDPDYALRRWERTLTGGAAETSDWFEEGKKHNAEHMLVVLDTEDYERYPVYVYSGEDLRFHKERCSVHGQRVVGTYDLKEDKREQISSQFDLL